MEKKQNVPALRFQGFSGEWNTHTLESMCDVFTDGDWIEANDQSNVGIRLIQTGNIGVTEYTDKPKHKKWISKETFDRLHCTAVLPGDILISRLPEPAGRACVIPDLGMEMITAVDCTIARVAEAYSKEYLVQYLSTAKYFSEVRDCLAGGTRQRISRGNLSIFTIPVPADKTEQDKIGDFFEWLDNCIAVKKQKIQKLQQFRQAMLTKLFPQDGVGKPELYFEGGLNCWKAFCLEDCAERLDNLRVPVSATNRIAGTTPYYGANGIQDYVSGYTHEGEFILIAEDGANDLDNYPIQYVNGKIWVNNHAHVLQGKTKIADTKFLKYALSQVNMRFYLVGGSRSKLNSNIMMNIELKLPIDINEQRKIGDFLGNLDRYISLQQKKLERMQRLKAALLEKLFV